MPFLLLARDDPSPGTLERRLAVREAHLALGDRLKADGVLLYAAAIMDDDGRMVGSMEVIDLPAREDVDAYLASEPYMQHGVWRDVTVEECKVGPAFDVPAAATAN